MILVDTSVWIEVFRARRRFDLEAEAWLNTITNHRRGFEADSRQLVSVPKILDPATTISQPA